MHNHSWIYAAYLQIQTVSINNCTILIKAKEKITHTLWVLQGGYMHAYNMLFCTYGLMEAITLQFSIHMIQSLYDEPFQILMSYDTKKTTKSLCVKS